jgi:hypothetical protein
MLLLSLILLLLCEIWGKLSQCWQGGRCTWAVLIALSVACDGRTSGVPGSRWYRLQVCRLGRRLGHRLGWMGTADCMLATIANRQLACRVHF